MSLLYKTLLGLLLSLGCLLLQKYVFDSPPTLPSVQAPVTGNKVGSSKQVQPKQMPRRLFTKEELASYVGKIPDFPPYLACLGDVFDVSRKMSTYGPEGSYHFFTGKDGSRAFATGKFTETGLVDNIDGLTPAEVAGIEEWNQVYKRDYDWIGKLIGTYYDSEGKATDSKKNIQNLLKQNNDKEEEEKELRKTMPHCNMKYSQDDGRTIWCSAGSGGIQRTWDGYPRQRIVKGKESLTTECVCVQENLFQDPALKVYENCAPKSRRCDWDKDGKPVVRNDRI